MNFWPANYEKSNREETQKFPPIKVSEVFIQIPGTYENMLIVHTGIPVNAQNNCIKLSGFGVDITRIFLHRKITRNISCPRKVLQLRKFFRSFLGTISYTSPIIHTFIAGYIKLVTSFSPNRPKFTDKKTLGVSLYIYNILKMRNWTKLLPWKLWWYLGKTKTDYYKKIYSCSNNLFLVSLSKILKPLYLLEIGDKFHLTGDVSPTQICTIIPSNIKIWH